MLCLETEVGPPASGSDSRRRTELHMINTAATHQTQQQQQLPVNDYLSISPSGVCDIEIITIIRRYFPAVFDILHILCGPF